MPVWMDHQRARAALVGVPLVALVVVLAVVAGVVSSCQRGVADQVGAHRVEAREAAGRDSSPPVVRRVPAPPADPATPIPDQRCRAARRLFLRAGADAEPRGVGADDSTAYLLDLVRPMADDATRADLDAFATLAQRVAATPGPLRPAEKQAAVELRDRLLIWTVTHCPPPQRPVWGCSSPVVLGTVSPFSGSAVLATGQLAPDEAVIDRLGEPEGRRIELYRSQNRVVFGWIDGFGLVRRRVEVQRVFDHWFLVDARRCDDASKPEDLPDGEEVVLPEELPDIEDGPEYAPTTTTTEPVGPTSSTTSTIPWGSVTTVPSATTPSSSAPSRG